MTEDNTKKEETKKDDVVTPAAPVVAATETAAAKPVATDDKKFGDRKPFKKNTFERKRRPRQERPKPEFEQKIINISKVTRVVKGGRRLSFRVDMIIGDRKGRVGLGSGKSTDTALAIEKAYRRAQKGLIKVGRTKDNSIQHTTEAQFDSSNVMMWPNGGRGVVAGSTVRNIIEFAGITDITAKIISRSENKLNNAKSALKALAVFEIPQEKKENPEDSKDKKDEDKKVDGEKPKTNIKEK